MIGLAITGATGAVGWEIILGPSGLLVASIVVNVVLWRKLNKKDDEHTKEVNGLHKAMHDDLIGGLRYREEISGRLLEDKIEERETANKLADAVKSLATEQEKTHETVRMAEQAVRDVKTIVSSKLK